MQKNDTRITLHRMLEAQKQMQEQLQSMSIAIATIQYSTQVLDTKMDTVGDDVSIIRRQTRPRSHQCLYMRVLILVIWMWCAAYGSF